MPIYKKEVSKIFCNKCKKSIPDDSIYCCYCGRKQIYQTKSKKRANGIGSVYKEPKGTYRAVVVLGYKVDNDGVKRPVRRTKNGIKTRKEAELWLSKLKGTKISRKDYTLQQIYDEFMPIHRERVSKSTMDCYKSAFKYLSDISFFKMREITTADIQKCIDNCPHGVRTKENMRSLCTLLYKYAIANQAAEKDYAQYCYIDRKDSKKEPNYFTAADIEKIKNAIGSVEYADYVYCLIYLGLRPAEFFALQNTDYSFEDKAFTVKKSKTNAGVRKITVSPKIRPIVEKYCNTSGQVFKRSNGTELTYNYFVKNIWTDCIKDIGLPKYSPYACRHTFATLMKNINAPEEDKIKLMGHTSIDMTRHYTHSDLDSLQQITDNI